MNNCKAFYRKNRVIIWTVLGIGFVFLLWYVLSLLINSTLFPGPQIVIPEFFVLLSEGGTYAALMGTIVRLLTSFILAFICGAILGIVGGLNKSFRAFLRPLIVILKTPPSPLKRGKSRKHYFTV